MPTSGKYFSQVVVVSSKNYDGFMFSDITIHLSTEGIFRVAMYVIGIAHAVIYYSLKRTNK